MIVIVAGFLTVKPDRLSDFEDGIAAVLQKIRSEDGCIHYSILVDDRTLGRISMTEVWRDKTALDAHLSQPWVKELFKSVGTLITADTTRVYDAHSREA